VVPREGEQAVTVSLSVGGLELRLVRPPDAEALIDEAEFARDEFLPYWAELWPAAPALARAVAERAPAGLRVVELGCGLGLPSVVAALAGASEVLATDWSPDALAFARRNAELNGARIGTALVDWRSAEELVRRAPWDLVLGSDLLYERRNVEPLLALLPRLGAEALLAEPGRPFAPEFLGAAAERGWRVEPLPERVYRLTRRASA
jgi:predicted nicotinamide N-methyase